MINWKYASFFKIDFFLNFMYVAEFDFSEFTGLPQPSRARQVRPITGLRLIDQLLTDNAYTHSQEE